MPRHERSAATRVSVPGGVFRDGGVVRELTLRPVSGADEAFLLESAAGSLPSERATALLARCLDEADAPELADRLTAGDREALLLHLRRITLGDAMECLVACPACGERMELELRTSDLLVPPYEVAVDYEIERSSEAVSYRVRFRTPTAKDLDAAAMRARQNPADGDDELFRRCVIRAEVGGVELPALALPASVREAVTGEMADRDPQAELTLELGCPSCSAESSVVFDAATFLLQELDRRAERLLEEVHTLALRYHWSEADILAMSARRRVQYLELLASAGGRR
jgi:hypothetical protein